MAVGLRRFVTTIAVKVLRDVLLAELLYTFERKGEESKKRTISRVLQHLI